MAMRVSGTKYRVSISEAKVRQVWAVLTEDAQLPVREIAERAGCVTSTVTQALKVLKHAGYIEYRDTRHRARRVVVPLMDGMTVRGGQAS
jgi:DNA-binding MarR family transcriptional regulator